MKQLQIKKITEMEILKFGTNPEHHFAYFNCLDKKGNPSDAFVFDFHTQKKYVYSQNVEDFDIAAISPCGEKVIAIDMTYDKSTKKVRIFNTKNTEEIAAFKAFWVVSHETEAVSQ